VNRGGIEFPEPAYASYGYTNREYDTSKFRYGYQSFITPLVGLRVRHGQRQIHAAEAERRARRL